MGDGALGLTITVSITQNGKAAACVVSQEKHSEVINTQKESLSID